MQAHPHTPQSESDAPGRAQPARTWTLWVGERNRSAARLLLSHLRTHAITWAAIACAGWMFVTNYRLLPNATQSLRHSWFVAHLHAPVKRGDYVAFRLPGNGLYPDDLWWVKRVAGAEGDLVTMHGSRYYVNGREVAVAQPRGASGKVLPPLVVPEEGRRLAEGEYFVVGDHVFSVDSRYALVGILPQRLVQGRAYALF